MVLWRLVRSGKRLGRWLNGLVVLSMLLSSTSLAAPPPSPKREPVEPPVGQPIASSLPDSNFKVALPDEPIVAASPAATERPVGLAAASPTWELDLEPLLSPELGPTVAVTETVSQPAAPSQVLVTPEKGGVLHSSDGWVEVWVPAGAVAEPAYLQYEPLPSEAGLLWAFRLGLVAEKSGAPLAKVEQPLRLVLTPRVPAKVALRAQAVRRDMEKGAWTPLAQELSAESRSAEITTSELGEFGLLSGGGSSDGTENLLGPSIEGLQADLFTGNGSYYYPMPVPALPGSLGLSLGLSYSSEEANGMLTENGNYEHYSQASWAGLGWSLSGLGRIYRSDTDMYLSFGSGSYRLLYDTGNSWKTEPHSFLRIEHVPGSSGLDFSVSSHRWDVWTTDGSHYVFGNPDNAWGSGTAYSKWDDCGMPDDERGYAWHLTEVYDTHGNRIEVGYAHEYGQFDGCGSPYRTYVRATRPTGLGVYPAGAAQPTVRVVFGSASREDWRLSLGDAISWPWHQSSCSDTMRTGAYWMFSCHRLSRVDVQARQGASWYSVGSYDLAHLRIGNDDPSWYDRYYHIVLKEIQARGAATPPGTRPWAARGSCGGRGGWQDWTRYSGPTHATSTMLGAI